MPGPIKWGDWRHTHQKPIKVKKHGRLSISYFRYGLDWIRQALLDRQNRITQLEHTIDLLIEAILGVSMDTELEAEPL